MEGQVYHKSLFKCSYGGCRISPTSYVALERVLYCEHHFTHLFKEKRSCNHLIRSTPLPTSLSPNHPSCTHFLSLASAFHPAIHNPSFHVHLSSQTPSTSSSHVPPCVLPLSHTHHLFSLYIPMHYAILLTHSSCPLINLHAYKMRATRPSLAQPDPRDSIRNLLAFASSDPKL